MSLPLVVAITGASGVIYGVEMLRALKTLGQETHLILSEAAVLNLMARTRRCFSGRSWLQPPRSRRRSCRKPHRW